MTRLVVKLAFYLVIVTASIGSSAAQNPCNLKPRTVPGGAYKVGGEVLAPVPVATPDPDLSGTARAAEQKIRLWVVLDCSGIPALVRVYAPQDGDSDEKAIAQWGVKVRDEVLYWKFQPATRGKEPIVVQFDIEFTFQPHEPTESPSKVSVTHRFIWATRQPTVR